MNKEIYTDHAIISWVLDHCKILHLGLNDHGKTYVVPVNFGYEEDKKGQYVIYIHGTADGQKGKLLDSSKAISFETDGGHEGLIYTPPDAGAFAPSTRSVIGDGSVERITDSEVKVHALRTLIHHYVRDIPAVIKADDLANVPVWQIKVDHITAKIHHPTAQWQSVLGLDDPLLKGYHYDQNGQLTKVDPTNGKPDAKTGASAK